MCDKPASEQFPESVRDEGKIRTWHLSVSYDGTDFHGWQIQPCQRTVQGELQQRLRRLFRREDLRIVGCSRTDAGVHALDQRVSFAVVPPAGLDTEGLRRLLNRWLPADIRVNGVWEAAAGFSARFDNCGKAYTYCLHVGEKPHPLYARFVWHVPRPLDLAAMSRGAAKLEGERDFASFAVNARREIDSTVRRIERIEVLRSGELLCISVVGESFLYKMVRSLVGHLVAIGLGRASVGDIEAVLAARDRTAASESAPAAGLFLTRVFFSAEEMRAYRAGGPPFGVPI